MIPKIIHYCWFGEGEMPAADRVRIEEWRQICPDYQIKLWDESNFDVSSCRYMKEAYECKKWGFVPDYARLAIVYEHGGIYLDTDVELLTSPDSLLNYEMFCGFESEEYVNFGSGFGAIKGHPIIKEMMERYERLPFRNDDGSLNLIPSPQYQTEVLVKHGLQLTNRFQIVDTVAVLPTEYLCPKDYTSGAIKVTENTIAIHHFAMSWFSRSQKIENRIRLMLLKAGIGRKFAINSSKIVGVILAFDIERMGSGLKKIYQRLRKKIKA